MPNVTSETQLLKPIENVMILATFVCRGRRKKSYSLARSRSALRLPGSADI